MGRIHLVRHGQASWGADDYDWLSALGTEQAILLGTSWEASGYLPERAWAGGMRRHAQTAVAALDAAGPSDGYDVDHGWDEFDHVAVLSAHDPDALQADGATWAGVWAGAMGRWTSGDHDDYPESFAAFGARVGEALERAVEAVEEGGSLVVFTSGGPVAAATSLLLTGGLGLFDRLALSVVNASVTTVVTGAHGPRLLTFNEHTHLPADAVTFR